MILTVGWCQTKNNTDFLEIDHSLLEMPLRGLELEKVPIAFFEFKTLQSSYFWYSNKKCHTAIKYIQSTARKG